MKEGLLAVQKYPCVVKRTEEITLALRTLVTRTADNSAGLTITIQKNKDGNRPSLLFGGGRLYSRLRQEYPRAVRLTEEMRHALRTLVTRTADNSAVLTIAHLKNKDGN